MKESLARMEKIPSTMVLHKHVDWLDTRISTMVGPLANNPLDKWIGVIKRGSQQASSEDSRWEYNPVSVVLPDIEPISDSINDGSSYEGGKDQENPYYQEQEEVVLVTCRNPRRLTRGGLRALSQLKSDIKRSKGPGGPRRGMP